ncbi:MAG TPA: UDP-N-acetylmuramoyl-L-alanyl-D-glutamate--2,6-diaminopimelate ligase [Burkholderiaceae bacterium]|nr:UDP-N-acetylmuramoyl-L-alanyl-D-glutamate--2,6-diaminopimelate ligase [Burkholderiaceae bacterium]
MTAATQIRSQLPDVAAAVTWLRSQGARRLQSDSRQVQSGDAFVAWPGFASDGRQYVPAARAAGAVACLVEAQGLPDSLAAEPDVASLVGLKASAGWLASEFCGQPSTRVKVLAVTGTNGKTTTSWWLAQALAALGKPCGLMGTLGVGVPGVPEDPLKNMMPTGLTTPDPVMCHTTLQQWADQGVWACAVEASSIGVAEHRLAGVSVAVAVFTNFTQDHLDYHGSMDAYWLAKRAVFATPGLGAAVVNADDPRGAQLALELSNAMAGTGPDVWTVSLRPEAGARLTVVACQPTAEGMRCSVEERMADATTSRVSLVVPFVGAYNAANLLGVLATLRALGISLADAVQACARLTAVPGRMAAVKLPDADAPVLPMPPLPLVLVDYAHTPDALDKALQALRPVTRLRGGALHCLIGCGGDRDASKRPLMAASAEAAADHLCLTSDNPRSEDPMTILAHMVAGLQHPERTLVQPDRARAIAGVIAGAAANDVVLIAGKGHETTQDIGGVKLPFSDHDHALAALRSRVQEVQA